MAQGRKPQLGDRSKRVRPGVRALFAAGVALVLAGCVETRETWVFDGDGGGTYSLSLRWNADLWSRVAGIVGGAAARRVEGRPFPVRADDWRDGLTGLDGVVVDELVEQDAGAGFRETSVRLTFRKIEDVLRWEVLARRRVRVATGPDGILSLRMEPLAQVAVVDTLAAMAAARLPDPSDDARWDPALLAETGVTPEDAALVARLLQPHLARLRFRFRIQTPGPLLTVSDQPVEGEPASASVDVTFDDLVRGRDRSIRCSWRPRSLDRPPLVEHEGDASPPVLWR